ncbi:protein YgfX [Reinekea blandensis]|uniref:L-aspartate oxidase n=1 Tax=Reinekea blandensis MED297 TaxID=314283 RepID=A4BBI8_9GAMM|nr:protein YgfX [Reinekea blandensis]EAR10323.1 L-aspartate oxidase [Reinekea sp. MED297] [Reinekea blandensis MED297]
MPVRVECTIRPSRLRFVYASVPLIAGVLLGLVLALPVWTALLWLILGYLLWAHSRSYFEPEYLRFYGEDLTIWQNNAPIVLQWQGHGRRSHAFIQWRLLDTQGQTLTLRIWRDSVSDASWRALNMAFRVALPSARQAGKTD